ncbi:MAG: ATP-binding cassette domain-containing protein, partial [Eubacterium sp.]|nr:ATP-binding cassette domain-containing protein [Eubacterium sp.]
PEYLSGGELRRLIIARTIYAEPKVILADEPTNDLDEDNRRVILKLLKKLTEKGITVITVTHESQVREYADECLELENGVIGKCY